jgi:hypothetical protein
LRWTEMHSDCISAAEIQSEARLTPSTFFCFIITLDTGPSRPLSLELSDPKVNPGDVIASQNMFRLRLALALEPFLSFGVGFRSSASPLTPNP